MSFGYWCWVLILEFFSYESKVLSAFSYSYSLVRKWARGIDLVTIPWLDFFMNKYLMLLIWFVILLFVIFIFMFQHCLVVNTQLPGMVVMHGLLTQNGLFLFNHIDCCLDWKVDAFLYGFGCGSYYKTIQLIFA